MLLFRRAVYKMAYAQSSWTVDEATVSKGAAATVSSKELFWPITSTTASFNNQGVESLRAGEWTRALNFFRAALRSTASDCIAEGFGVEGRKEELPSVPLSLAHQVVSIHSSCNSDFLHAVGFYLNPSAKYFDDDSDKIQSCAVQSAVIWYNLGLLLHVKSSDGVVSAESDDNVGARMRLDKALSLYMRTKSVLETLGVFDRGFNNCSPGFLQIIGMATLNNLAYALYQREHWSASQECLVDLTQWIFQMEKQHRSAQPQTSIEAASLEIFEWNRSSCLLNAMILQPPRVASAA